MREALDSPWGRLFRNWEQLTPTADGYPTVGGDGAEITRTGDRALVSVVRDSRHVPQGSTGVRRAPAAQASRADLTQRIR